MKLISKIPSLCLATICCAALAPLARAVPLTIVQTLTWTASGGVYWPSSALLTGNFIFLPFSAAGTLLSVQFDSQIALHATVVERNLFSLPEAWTPALVATPSYFFQNFTTTNGIIYIPSVSQEGAPRTLTESQAGSFSADFPQSYTKLFTSSPDLSQFAAGGTGTNRIMSSNSVFGGPAFGGGTSATETGTMTLTYTYNTVPEATASLTLLALGLGAVALGFRFLPRKFSA